jgi:pyrimidine 5'-nucleotidase
MDVALFSVTAVVSVWLLLQQQQQRNSNNNITSSDKIKDTDGDSAVSILQRALRNRTSLNANEAICIVTADNEIVPGGGVIRADMRLRNLWHRATYVLILHHDHRDDALVVNDDSDDDWHNVRVLVQKRSLQKDYCPGRLDPMPGGVVEYGETYRENAVRELEEEMGIVVPSYASLNWLYTFPYEDDHVRVWGDVYECHYHGSMTDLVLQKEEVDSIVPMSLQDLKDRIDTHPHDFMPHACHAMKLYFQRLGDLRVRRRLLKGYSSGNLDSYRLRPKPKVVFFDCDDCLYFDGWKTANHLTQKIDDWCVQHGLEKGDAYELYKKYGTALRGLLAEGYLEQSEAAIDGFLEDVHDIPVHNLLQPDKELREMLLRMDSTIPKYVFTASVRDHAARCLQALGIADLFHDIIDCTRCDLETKHSQHSFETAMRVAGVREPEECLFFDDNLTNISAARKIGWRSILVGKVGRDCGKSITSEHAELEIDRIHDAAEVLPELFQ